MSSKLSVVIPVHNGKRRIRKTAIQILRQDYENLELVLVENGSKDDSWQECKKIKALDPRVIAIQSEKGTSLARKAGVLQSTGEWIAFSDQDDSYINRFALSNMVKTAEDNNADIVQFSHMINSFGRKRIAHQINKAKIITRAQLLDEYVGGVFGAYNGIIPPTVWSKIYKGAVLRKAVNSISATLCRGEDMYLNTLAFLEDNVQRVALEPKSYYIWNSGIGTSSSKDGGVALFEEYRIIKPTILCLAGEKKVGYEPIMRTHRETLNFLNGLIEQSILSGDSKEETLRMLNNYATYDFVLAASRFFDSNQPNGEPWDQHILQRADLSNPERYYQRVYQSIGNVPAARLKYKLKRITKDTLRLIDRLK